MTNPTEITVDGVVYVQKGALPDFAARDGQEYVIVRSRDAGVFAGWVTDAAATDVTIYEARRLWYWDGAATLSELALFGVKKPGSCKFPDPLPVVHVFGVCEIIPATEVARESIAKVKPWRA